MNKKDSSQIIIKRIKDKIKLMNFIIQGIEIFGVKKFDKQLMELGILKSKKNEPIHFFDNGKIAFYDDEKIKRQVDFIVDCAIKVFGFNVKKEDIFLSNQRLENTEIKDISYFIIRKYTYLSDERIGIYFNLSRQAIHGGIIRHKKRMKLKNKNYAIRFNEIDRIVRSNIFKIKL